MEPGAAKRSGIILFTRSVDMLEQSHGKGHSQDLKDKERTLKGCSRGLGLDLKFHKLGTSLENLISKWTSPSVLGNEPGNRESVVWEVPLETWDHTQVDGLHSLSVTCAEDHSSPGYSHANISEAWGEGGLHAGPDPP